jgi:hypothetical protein
VACPDGTGNRLDIETGAGLIVPQATPRRPHPHISPDPEEFSRKKHNLMPALIIQIQAVKRSKGE